MREAHIYVPTENGSRFRPLITNRRRLLKGSLWASGLAVGAGSLVNPMTVAAGGAPAAPAPPAPTPPPVPTSNAMPSAAPTPAAAAPAGPFK
ncbi:MAG: hypothetical protein ACREN8_06770, partial [Candidatus Dormibacteraceae bacterium]